MAAGLGSLLAYAPRVLAAGAILLGGIVAAEYARRAATRAAEDSGIDYASTLGTLVFVVVAFAIGLMAVSQLQVATDAVWLTLGWMLAGLALALGLSFGLGARDVTRNILAGFYARRISRIGQQIENAGAARHADIHHAYQRTDRPAGRGRLDLEQPASTRSSGSRSRLLSALTCAPA